uniref:Uncharacterized protein n=1 Tax=Eutreptiella gymnastica TaxID=73025 RepID=A0A7S4G0J1_9EUGL
MRWSQGHCGGGWGRIEGSVWGSHGLQVLGREKRDPLKEKEGVKSHAQQKRGAHAAGALGAAALRPCAVRVWAVVIGAIRGAGGGRVGPALEAEGQDLRGGPRSG